MSDSEADTSRPRREVSKVLDYKSFHRTGEDTGKVAAAIKKIETPNKSKQQQQPPTPSKMSSLDKLREELEKQKALTQKAQEELEEAKLQSQLEAEKRKQAEIEATKSQINLKTIEANQSLEDSLKDSTLDKDATIKMLQEKIMQLSMPKEQTEQEKKQQQAADQLRQLMQQQQELARAAKEAVKECDSTPEIQQMLQSLQATEAQPPAGSDQNNLMEQLMSMMRGKKQESPLDKQKEILQHFLTEANKVTTTGGATTLKPELLKRITGESDKFNIGEWLAKLSSRSIDESKCENCNEDCKQHKKSGMLDKATTSIQIKQTWPQKNLTEDWADEEIEFKHLQFEHMVAGEMRTIQTCTEPAQIIGRMSLLKRMAYAKLRGYEWHLIRKMYAAILRSIEAREHTWESNFDRFEAILYRRPPQRREDKNTSGLKEVNNNKKWFCRDWNKGNCTKSAPHKSWFGTGTNAVSRTVLHMCATCYMKDKVQKDHPENHETCPHKEA